MNRQRGFSIVEIIIVVAVIVVLALIGWRLWQRMGDDQPSDQTNSTTSQTSQQQTPPINNAQDLDKASRRLNDVNVDGDYSKQLDQQTGF
ncbi:MAG TPA: prepilin-type N-terminal cleavage/methylation domain-containing protein [Candidatus Saccharimonadales bacterium]|nr:prepilin-type N-terminal cleavage/methylation domain-containing protein [Candidatus Saccharimonadales bacterium]